MPTGGNPYAIPSPIKINYTPVAPETSGLTALMAVQKAVAQQQLMAARAAAAAARASGAGGAGAKYTNYVRLPKDDGTFEMVPVVGADKDNRAAQEKALMSSRLAQLAAQDKDLQESLSKMNGLSVKGQKMELEKIRQQHIPRLVKQWGISPELGAEFMKQNTASIADNINQQQKAINETGVLQTFIDSTKMGATALWDAIRSLGSTPDEKFAMGEAQSKQRQEILAQNAHLREEALRAQEGIDSWSDFFDNKTLNVAEALGDTLSGAGGIIGTQAGAQALVSGIGKGLTAIPHPAAKAAGIALQTPVARTGVALLTGGGTGAGLGGMNLANRLVAEVEAGRMTRAEAIDALEKGQLPAQLLGGGVGAAFSAMPAVNLLPKGIPMLTRSAATKRGQDYIRKQAIKASLDEGAGSALARIAGERSVQQAVADYNAPGIMAAAGRYFKAMPRTAVDLAAFNAADTLAGNVAYSQATGQPMSLDGVGQAAMAGVASAPFFALMGTRAHYNPPRGRTFISGVEEIVPELPAGGRQYGLPEGGSVYRPKQPTPPGRSGAPWWEAAGFENEAAYRAAEAHAYAEAATRRAEAMRAQNAGGASQRSSAYAPGSLWDLLQNFPAPVASDMWSDRQTPGTVWPVNAPSQPPIRRAQQSSAQPATSTPPSVPNPAASATRPEVIATINAAQGNAKQWGPTEISKLYRELAIGKLDPDEARTYMNALVDKKDQPKQKALAAALAQYDAVSATLGRAAKNHIEAPVLKELIKNTGSLPEALEAAITLLDRQDITVKEFEDLRKTAKTQDIRRALLQTQRLFENGEISHEQVKVASGDGHEPTPTQDTASIGGGTTPSVAGNGQLGKGGTDTTNPPRNSGAATDSQAITPNPADQLPQSPAGSDTANESGGDTGLSAQNTGTTEAPARTSDVKVSRKPRNANGEPGSSPAATEPPAADTGERSAELTASAGKGGDGATEQAGANESDPVARIETEAQEAAADEALLQQILDVVNRGKAEEVDKSAVKGTEKIKPGKEKMSPENAEIVFTRNINNLEISPEESGGTKLSGESRAVIEGYINDALNAGVKPADIKSMIKYSSRHDVYNPEISSLVDNVVNARKQQRTAARPTPESVASSDNSAREVMPDSKTQDAAIANFQKVLDRVYNRVADNPKKKITVAEKTAINEAAVTAMQTGVEFDTLKTKLTNSFPPERQRAALEGLHAANEKYVMEKLKTEPPITVGDASALRLQIEQLPNLTERGMTVEAYEDGLQPVFERQISEPAALNEAFNILWNKASGKKLTDEQETIYRRLKINGIPDLAPQTVVEAKTEASAAHKAGIDATAKGQAVITRHEAREKTQANNGQDAFSCGV